MRMCTAHGQCTDCAKCRDEKDVRLSVDLSDLALAVRLLGPGSENACDAIAQRIDAIAKELLEV